MIEAWEAGQAVIVALLWWVVALSILAGMTVAAAARGAIWAAKRLYARLSPAAPPEAPEPPTDSTGRPTTALRLSATPSKTNVPTKTEGAH